MKTHQEQCTRRVAKRSGRRNERTVADILADGEFFVITFSFINLLTLKLNMNSRFWLVVGRTSYILSSHARLSL